MDILGIGIGPSNLSLAALLNPLSQLTSLFLDKEKSFHWHRGMQLPCAQMQVSYLKDLVTLIDPQNPFSFLAFLVSQRRLYQFINANFQQVSRAEFNQYYHWACSQLSAKLHFNEEVKEVKICKQQFQVRTQHKKLSTTHLVLGTGLLPYLPSCAKNNMGETALHSSDFINKKLNTTNKRIAVIGGGQSSAEIILHLLSNQQQLPQEIYWISSRGNFLPLDSSPFVNEVFTPNYSNYFHSLPSKLRKHMLTKQKMWSDGISLSTLEDLYRTLYKMNYILPQKELVFLMPENEVFHLEQNTRRWSLRLRHAYHQREQQLDADIVIFCTGYRYLLPHFLDPINKQICRDESGELIINADYSLQTELPSPTKIFIQNGARHSKGIADPNLSLCAWRSALIINSITQQKIYNTDDYHSFFHWEKPYSPH